MRSTRSCTRCQASFSASVSTALACTFSRMWVGPRPVTLNTEKGTVGLFLAASMVRSVSSVAAS